MAQQCMEKITLSNYHSGFWKYSEAIKHFIRLTLISLVIRVAYLLQHAGSPFFARPLLDQHYYDLCARQLAGAGGDLIDGFRPLLYPLFLSVFYRINLDSGVLFALLTQHAMGISMSVMIAWLAFRLFNSTKAGVAAGLLFAFSAPPLYFEGELLITTLFSFLLLLLWMTIYQALHSDEKSSIGIHPTTRPLVPREARPTQDNPEDKVSDECRTQLFCEAKGRVFDRQMNMNGRRDACGSGDLSSANTVPLREKESALWLIAGILLGLAAQARPNALPLLIFFPLVTLIRLFSKRHKSAPGEHALPVSSRHAFTQKQKLVFALSPLSALVGLVLIQAVFGAINAHYSGHFSLTTQAGGINFYLGNGQHADGMIPRQSKHVVYEGEYRDPIQVMAEQDYRAATGKTGAINPSAISKYWTDTTIKEIRQDPKHWMGLMAKKCWLMFWNHEVPNNRSFAFNAKEETSLLRWLPVRWWVLLALLPWGIASIKYNGDKKDLLWPFTFLILFSGTLVLFFVNSRFRIPLWPVLSVLGGGGIIYLREQTKSFPFTSQLLRRFNIVINRERTQSPKHLFFLRSTDSLSVKETAINSEHLIDASTKRNAISTLIPAVTSILLILLSTLNWLKIPEDPIEHDLSMRAGLYLETGQYDKALQDITHCLTIAPNNPRYHFVLGNIFLAQENNPAAINAYLRAIRLDPNDPMFHNNLGIAFENQSDFPRAELAYQNALKLQPQHFAARTNLMLLKLRVDEIDQSRRLLQPLLQQAPDNPTLLCAKMMMAYKLSGDPEALKIAHQLNLQLAEQLSEE